MVVDAFSLQGVSTLDVVITMLSVWQEHTASVCEAYWAIAVDKMHIHFGVMILPIAAAFTVLRSSRCHCNA